MKIVKKRWRWAASNGVTVWFGRFNFFSTLRPQPRPLFLTIGVSDVDDDDEDDDVDDDDEVDDDVGVDDDDDDGFNIFLTVAATLSHHRCCLCRCWR